MPSPVWLDNESATDPNDILDELLLDGDDDEYFDQQRSAKRKPTSDGAGAHILESTEVPSKRQKLSMTGLVPDEPVSKPPQSAPIVVWRTQCHSSVSYPIVSDGVEAGVALLENWRERFKGSVNGLTHGLKRHSSQIAFAVVVERRQKKERLFPVENTSGGSVAKPKIAKSQLQNVQSTAAPRRKANNKLGSTATAVHRPALAQKGNATTAASMKRKAPETEDEEDELQADDGISARPKKRVMTETKCPSPARAHRSASVANGPLRKKSVTKSEPSKLRTKRSTARPKDKSKTKSVVKRSTPQRS